MESIRKIKVFIYNIDWDMDEDDDTELSKEIEYTFSGYNNINDEDLLEEISNWLTD